MREKLVDLKLLEFVVDRMVKRPLGYRKGGRPRRYFLNVSDLIRYARVAKERGFTVQARSIRRRLRLALGYVPFSFWLE